MARYWVDLNICCVSIKDSHNNDKIEWCEEAIWDDCCEKHYVAWESEVRANQLCAKMNGQMEMAK